MNWIDQYILRKKYSKDDCVENSLNHPYVLENMFRGNPYIKEVALHKGTIYIEDKAFKNCISLEKINIPPKVEYLTFQVFYGCVSLREIIVERTLPPKYYPDIICCMPDVDCDDDGYLLHFCVRIKELFAEKSNCFYGVDRKQCIIRVPKGSVDLYREAYEWKEFEKIVEL